MQNLSADSRGISCSTCSECLSSGGEQLLESELISSGSDYADAPKTNPAKTPRQREPIFQLGGEHIAI
jgi:hypothetical protein